MRPLIEEHINHFAPSLVRPANDLGPGSER